MPKHATRCLLLFVVLSATGCLQYRASALEVAPVDGMAHRDGDPDSVFRSRTTSWSLGWGVLRAGSTRYSCEGEGDHAARSGLQEVTVSSPPHYTLLTLITLGLASPKRIEVKCAKIEPVDGRISMEER
jgi:hypothetical protein